MTPKPAEYRSIRVSRREQELLDALAAILVSAESAGDAKERLADIAATARAAADGMLERGKVGLKPQRLRLKVGSLEIDSGLLAHECKILMDGRPPPFRVRGLYLQVKPNEPWKIVADILPRPAGWGGEA